MIERCNNEKLIEEYIGDIYDKCLYIYLDYVQYGINNPNVLFFVQKNKKNEVTAIMMLYYKSGLNVYSKKDDCDCMEIAKFISENTPNTVLAEGKLIRKIDEYTKELKYKSEFGRVWKVDSFGKVDRTNVENAKEEDFDEITMLLLADPDMGMSYTFDSLKKQLIERNKSGFSRNYVIKENGKVIAHTATGIETDKVAISSLTIVDENHRRMGLGTKLLNISFNDLNTEGKKIYFVNYTEESTNLYIKLGCKVVCEWGKLYKK